MKSIPTDVGNGYYICREFNIKVNINIYKYQMKLKNKYLKLIEQDEALKGLIAKKSGKSSQTVERWVRTDNEKLTMFSVTDTLRSYLKLKPSVVLTEKSEVAA